MCRFVTLGLIAMLAACEEGEFDEPMTFAGPGGKITVEPEVLEKGRDAYTHYCRQCHGDEGDGAGPAARGLSPRPRDFRKGEFKFAAVPAGELPSDADLERIVRGGLAGTAMLPWDISEEELHAVVQYIKTFKLGDRDRDGKIKPSKWEKKKAIGEVIAMADDPWAGKPLEEALARGKVVYHVKAQCGGCHPFYVTRRELYELGTAETGTGTTQLRPDPYLPELKESPAYGRILPPDFTFRVMRSVRPGSELADIYRSVASGIGGTAMPKWKGNLPEEDLWALVHYVKWLDDLRGTPEAQALRARLLGPDNRDVPADPPPPAPPAP